MGCQHVNAITSLEPPASWFEMLARFDGLSGLIVVLAKEISRMPEPGTLVAFAEFVVDYQSDGREHKLGFYAATDSPAWVDEQFALDLLQALHNEVAKGGSCACMRKVAIVTRDTECN